MCKPSDILEEVLSGYEDSDKWENAPFERIKRISNTKVGDVGQEFIERLCKCIGFDIAFPMSVARKSDQHQKKSSNKNRARQSPWDIQIEGIQVELKTATEDTNGAFQFNHNPLSQNL